MNIDLTTMKAIMESEKFALYIIEELQKKGRYKGIRLNKINKSQVGVYIEKNKEEGKYPPYRVVGFIDNQR